MKPVKIGVITSGGDVPGLNAALHAIVLTASKRNVSVTGIHDGFEGLIDGRFVELNFAMVRNLMHEGGTILQTSRSARFLLARFRKQAYAQLKRAEIDGLIIIGGNGSLQGADVFARQFNYPIIGVPKTIDNDVFGTDYAIGFDTAINTVVEAVDKIKDTADSTSRTFIVEVMGRTCGSLALHSGIAVAANAVIIPEIKPDIKKLLACMEHNQHTGNRSMIIIVTENTLAGGSTGLKKKIDARYPQLDCRVTILGHIQRGGSPTAYDRNLASLLGYHAATALLNGRKGLMAGSINGKVKFTPLSQIAGKAHAINTSMMDMANQFSLLI
jgi:6-phosphofructokinase 1